MPTRGIGLHALVVAENEALRLAQDEVETHPRRQARALRGRQSHEVLRGRGFRPAADRFLQTRNAKLVAGQEDALRQLVGRYEQLAENTLDAQQRVAADVSKLRSRAASSEQILRTVE